METAAVLNTVFAVSLLLLAIAVFLHVRMTRRKLNAIDFEDMKLKLVRLTDKLEGLERDLSVCQRDTAETKIRTGVIEHDLDEVKEESGRFMHIFKTVLYGFDYIVQGCKSALEINPSTRQMEKTINAENPESRSQNPE